MILLTHIVIALLAVGVSGLTLIKPTRRKLNTSYIFTIATFVTGSYLIVKSPAHLVPSCITGLVFLGVVGILIYFAQKKLATQN